ncbi:DcaP family trimeric outer membrane transporter [Acinetobacter sp. TSRC1-2]|uniref:DcaP family trimeric outer membrane transporter n=1 Tax=unclassified Acinetobacter TaxID=196816 RepID=UPI003CF0CC77
MRLLVNSLALTVITFMFNNAYAGEPEQQQIQELRSELEAVKAWIQQQNLNTPWSPHTQVESSPIPVNLTSDIYQKTAETSSLKWKSKAGAEVNLYGFVRADTAYQIEGGDAIFNRINKIALDGDLNKKSTEDRFDSTLTTTRIGIDFKTPVEDMDVAGKIEVDFRGGDKNETLRIRHAYLTLNNWLIGQTTSSFLSTETSPEMLDFNGLLGGGTFRTPMVRYSNKIDPNTQYFLGLEKGNEDNRLPTATAKISHKFADGSGMFTGRGLIQEVRARDVNNETSLGWGIGLGLSYQAMDKLALNANYSHIAGDNKYLLYNTNNYIKKGDDIDLIDLDTFTVGATYKFNSKLRSTIAYSAMYYDQNVEKGNDKLQQGWLNVMYNPVKPITVGLEYVYGERETVDGLSGTDNRLEVMVKYEF